MSISICIPSFLGTKEDITEGALWYHSLKVTPYWATSYVQTLKVDNHIFYKDVD